MQLDVCLLVLPSSADMTMTMSECSEIKMVLNIIKIMSIYLGSTYVSIKVKGSGSCAMQYNNT